MSDVKKAELRRLTIHRDMMGTIHIKAGDFDYVQIQYQYPYTDNASTQRLAEQVVAILEGSGEVEKLRAERDAALSEREELRRLLDCFVRGESEPDENQSERHMYVTEAQSLLAHMAGDIKAHTLVPDEVLRNQSAELEACRNQIRALIHISDATGWERHTCGEIAKARALLAKEAPNA